MAGTIGLTKIGRMDEILYTTSYQFRKIENTNAIFDISYDYDPLFTTR